LQGNLYHGYLNHAADSGQYGHELATGDLGYLDEDGFLFITGRRSDTIITGYGRNIAPAWLEAELQSHPAIAQAAVFAGDDARLTAIISPAAVRFSNKPDRQLRQAIREVNLRLPDYARIHDVIVAVPAFTVKRGEITANGKLRRDVIRKNYLQENRHDTRAHHDNIF